MHLVTRAPMPLEKGVQRALLIQGIDLPGNLLRSNSGVRVFRFNMVGEEDEGRASTEGVSLRPHEAVTVSG